VYSTKTTDIWKLGFGYSTRRYFELLHVLVVRNLKVRYRGSLLGVYWSLLNPLIMTGVYTLIFGTAFASYYSNSIVLYMLEAFVGLAAINFFSASTSQALTSIVANGSMMNKIRLPASVFPTSMIAANTFQFAVGTLPLLVLMTLVTSERLINVVALVIPILALIFVSAGVGLLISCLFVFFRDLIHLYELVLFLLLISSPIFYPEAIVPESVRTLLSLNPLFLIIETFRQIALSGNLPDLHLASYALLSSGIILMVGLLCFQRWRHQFMDLL
jgi:lipopolysaccharide transport system permease protein